MLISERDAKSFFVDKILAQATAESQPLSEAQAWMLRFSEEDPDFAVDHNKLEAFEQEVVESDYQARIVALLRRRYSQDVRADPSVTAAYRDAYSALRRGDHYLLLMIEPALGRRLSRPFSPRSVALATVLLVPAFVAGTIAIGLLWMVFTEEGSPGQRAIGVAASLVIAAMAYYLVHLWRR